MKWLASKKKYIRNVRGYMDLSTFALLCRVLREGGIQFGKETVTEALEEHYDIDDRIWDRIIKGLVDHTLEAFHKAASSARRREEKTITPANFVKNSTLVGDVMKRPIPANLRRISQEFKAKARSS